MKRGLGILASGALVLFTAVACGATPAHARETQNTAAIGATPTVSLEDTRSLDDIVPELAKRRVVFVGEIHSRYDHHLVQLHIIEALAARHAAFAIGVEWFQQPFQAVLDRYIAGEIDESELLRQSEYFDRWRYDFRLYAPILRFARARHVPVIALNLPTEVTRAAAALGVQNMPARLRQWLPHTLDRSNERYRQQLREIYEAHPRTEFSDFERFFTVQLLWDEGMAERAADFLHANPQTHMVVLAGSGHLSAADGIPTRLMRQTDGGGAVVLSQWEPNMSPRSADYLVLSQPRELPPAGALGVTIELVRDGGVRLREVERGSAAQRAGARRGDLLVAIDGTPVAALGDVRSLMWDKAPGDQVTISVRRRPADPKVVTFPVTLQ